MTDGAPSQASAAADSLVPAFVPATAVATAAAAQAGPRPRLIAYAATLRIEVRDLERSAAAVAALATDLGGYVQSSTLEGLPNVGTGTVRLRVPADRFQEAMVRLRALADVVLAEETSSQDVTEEYVDLGARLRALQAVEEQLLALINRADAVADVLAVQRELTTTRQSVERLQGRLQLLEQSVSDSTITVALRQRVSGLQTASAWMPGETFRGAAAALVHVLQGLGNVVIVAGVFAPIWAPIAGGVWWWRRQQKT